MHDLNSYRNDNNTDHDNEIDKNIIDSDITVVVILEFSYRGNRTDDNTMSNLIHHITHQRG